VDAVRREGGKVTLKDLASYWVVWSEPTRVMYRGFEVTSLGPPSLGGLQTLSALQLWERANVSKGSDYSQSADALYALIQIAKLEASLSFNSEDDLRKVFPGLDLSASARLSPATTNRLATILRNKNWFTNLLNGRPALPPNHSSGVVAVDDQGNLAALLHSCNCELWGTTGIFVDVISIPDPAVFQQAAVARTEPGGRLPDSTSPVIVLKDNRPVLASSAIGSGLHEVTLQNLINVLDLGMDPQAAVNRPNFMDPFLGITTNGSPKPELTEEVLDRGFPPSVVKGLKKRGQDIYAGPDGGTQSGYWIGIQIDPKSRALSGGATRRLNSFVEGY
jgi:gamma-glutamyltranspeptidase / glutathione hydrolase